MHTPSPLSAHLGYWLRYVSNHVSQAFARRLAAHDVSVAEWVLLRELFDHPSRAPSELADTMGMTRGAITKLVDRLLARGFVTREADPADGRAQRLALTPAGRALVPQLAALADANDEAFFGHLDPAVRAQLAQVLEGIVAAHPLTRPPLD
jgi:DNA-binding MarR family transcriptional regulator